MMYMYVYDSPTVPRPTRHMNGAELIRAVIVAVTAACIPMLVYE